MCSRGTWSMNCPALLPGMLLAGWSLLVTKSSVLLSSPLLKVTDSISSKGMATSLVPILNMLSALELDHQLRLAYSGDAVHDVHAPGDPERQTDEARRHTPPFREYPRVRKNLKPGRSAGQVPKPEALSSLLPGELALAIDEAVEPGGAGITFCGAACVYIPVEGLAVVAEAAVELPDEVGGDRELAPDEVVFLEGAHEVTESPELEGALEGPLPFLAADPGGAQAQVTQLPGSQAPLLAADLGCVEAEPRRLALAKDL